MKKITQRFFLLHQQLGLVVSLAIIAWAISGLSHPIITRINPAAVQFSAPDETLTPQIFPVEQLNKQFGPIHSLRLFNLAGNNIARLDNPQGTHYLDATKLEPIENFETHYARLLAQHFSGDYSSDIESITLVNTFDDDYLSVNRLLPVTRVQFKRADNLRVYVDTQQGRLATLVDDNKAATGAFFRALHTWSWWPSGTLKTVLLSTLLSLSLLVICMGLWLYLQRWRQGVFSGNARWPLSRRWHAHLNGATAMLALCFVASGLLHFLLSDEREANPSLPSSLPPSSLSITENVREAQWISHGDMGVWRLQAPQQAPSEHAHHGSAAPQRPPRSYQANGHEVADAEQQLALNMAQQWRQGAVKSVELQTMFSAEYGFINKRLPVTRVTYEDGSLVFVEVQTATLAAMVNPIDAIEGLSFGYLHKWHHLDLLGNNIRDSLLGLVALLIALGTGLGVYRYSRKYR